MDGGRHLASFNCHATCIKSTKNIIMIETLRLQFNLLYCLDVEINYGMVLLRGRNLIPGVCTGTIKI